MFLQKIRHRLSHLDAHHRLLISLAFATVAFLVFKGHLLWRTLLIATWDAYALCVLVLAWIRIVTAQPRVVVRLTTLQPKQPQAHLSFCRFRRVREPDIRGVFAWNGERFDREAAC